MLKYGDATTQYGTGKYLNSINDNGTLPNTKKKLLERIDRDKNKFRIRRFFFQDYEAVCFISIYYDDYHCFFSRVINFSLLFLFSFSRQLRVRTHVSKVENWRGKVGERERRRDLTLTERERAVGRPQQRGRVSRVERRGRAVRDPAGPAQTESTALPTRSLSIANLDRQCRDNPPSIAPPFIRQRGKISQLALFPFCRVYASFFSLSFFCSFSFCPPASLLCHSLFLASRFTDRALRECTTQRPVALFSSVTFR